ncbi:MAG: hypothetical protein WCF57_12360 [Pyrinomonadaceae bacterium]
MRKILRACLLVIAIACVARAGEVQNGQTGHIPDTSGEVQNGLTGQLTETGTEILALLSNLLFLF